MDRISTNDNIELHKQVHEMMCAVFKSMTNRLSGIKPELQLHPVEVLSKPSSPASEEGDEVSEVVSEYLK